MNTAQTPIADRFNALQYLQGKRSTATLRSKRTGKHYTYKISAPKGDKNSRVRFVRVLAHGSDNYQYLGMIRDGRLYATRATQAPGAPSFRAFAWALQALDVGKGDDLDVCHHGQCCQCGRKLTHPESIESGIGPVCGAR